MNEEFKPEALYHGVIGNACSETWTADCWAFDSGCEMKLQFTKEDIAVSERPLAMIGARIVYAFGYRTTPGGSRSRWWEIRVNPIQEQGNARWLPEDWKPYLQEPLNA